MEPGPLRLVCQEEGGATGFGGTIFQPQSLLKTKYLWCSPPSHCALFRTAFLCLH